MSLPLHRFAPVLHVLGLVILIFSFTMLAPLVTALIAHDAAQFAFDESFAVTLAAGFVLWLVGRRWRRELKVRDGFLLVLLASGLDFVSAFSAVIACINNAGPGLNEVGPGTNYVSLNDFQTWVLAFTMLLGRLELFTVFVLFTHAFWRG